ncbi:MULTISPECIES: biopolymer transporter ExbD [unclassified Oleiphilus]|jgi:biopolymer transport protein ExbD|uniref:ExbD/TolR family protein n=1 Tax=unclassified Oleiphilus TaxID=2631174 RepID=UPI0007C3BCA8|nr:MULTISPECIES: biopolymer transporter ExbD [unclassified Oleiphilus]KZY47767.1 biopolymer transporter ExbD [Oleiphilus sp. HI0050]KZZ35213.1 biopolymer transporter ExbD [Oleiphilus sp. HI0117]KZZ36756.1 biopolymer transporter ExbD [Oleiphilus sp. HI0086]KZZ58257.1 biopolymer transporter ExbD [Oleiphilus sp. HI0123]
MRYRQETEEEGQIDISPLIDMVFILLIFFMVTTTFVKDMKLDLDRPSASSAAAASTKATRVFIDKLGDVYVDNQPVRIYSLQSKLRDMLRVSTDKSVLVVTDENVPAKLVLEVIDQCKLSGATDVGVATEQES